MPDSISPAQPPEPPGLVCRPAASSDTLAVMELTSHIWDGEDYVPEVWEDWLADPEGLLAVGELAGQVVGLGKLTRLLPDSWWLEGLRVHPDYRGRGFASQIFIYLHSRWLEAGSGVVRLTTYSENAPVHHMCAAMGYQQIIAFTPYQAPALKPGPAPAFTRVQNDRVAAAVKIARASSVMAVCRTLLDLDWTWVELYPERLSEAADHGMLWLWHDGLGVLAGRTNTHPGEPSALYALCLACNVEHLGAFLFDFRRLAAEQGLAFAGWNVPMVPELQTIVIQSGYTRLWEDGSLYIYEYSHPEKRGAP